MFDRKIFSVVTLNLVSSLHKKLSHLDTSYHVLSHFGTPSHPCLIEINSHWHLSIWYPDSLKSYHILPHFITSYYTLLHILPFNVEWKNNLRDNFKFSLHSPYKVITSCCPLSRLLAPYYTLSPRFDRKIISVTTLNLVSSLLKKLSHLVTSYHIFSHPITLYLPNLIESYSQRNLKFTVQSPDKNKMSYHIFSHPHTPYHTLPPCLIENNFNWQQQT